MWKMAFSGDGEEEEDNEAEAGEEAEERSSIGVEKAEEAEELVGHAATQQDGNLSPSNSKTVMPLLLATKTMF